jgi:hypothetical protein
MTTPSNPNPPSEPERDRYALDASPGGVPPAQHPNYPGAYGYPGQPGYPQPGYPQPGYPIPRPTNGFAIASLVLGIIWIYWVGSILALIFGYIARKQIRERNESGDGMAIAGIVLGWVGIGVLVIVLIFVIIGIATGP